MVTRRTLISSGLASIILPGNSAIMSGLVQNHLAQLEYQGSMAYQNLPELPTAPDGQCAIVLQSHKKSKVAALVYHNASNEVVAVTSIVAESRWNFVPEESFHAPQILQPGEYGFACPTFSVRLEEDDEVTAELTVVPAAEADPALIEAPVTSVDITQEGNDVQVDFRSQNRSDHVIAPGYATMIVFFSPDGQILDWISTTSLSGLNPGQENIRPYGHNNMTTSDSFMTIVAGRITE